MRRLEAIDALAKIEIKVSQLRDKLYVERSAEVAKEHEMTLDGTHPELVHITALIEARRVWKLRTLETWFEEEQRHYAKMAAAEEREAQLTWRAETAELRRGLMDEWSSKRRKLEREKRGIDVPRPSRRHQVFETDLIGEPELAAAAAKAAQMDREPGATGRRRAKREARELAELGSHIALPDLHGLEDYDAWADLERIGVLRPDPRLAPQPMAPPGHHPHQHQHHAQQHHQQQQQPPQHHHPQHHPHHPHHHGTPPQMQPAVAAPGPKHPQHHPHPHPHHGPPSHPPEMGYYGQQQPGPSNHSGWAPEQGPVYGHHHPSSGQPGRPMSMAEMNAYGHPHDVHLYGRPGEMPPEDMYAAVAAAEQQQQQQMYEAQYGMQQQQQQHHHRRHESPPQAFAPESNRNGRHASGQARNRSRPRRQSPPPPSHTHQDPYTNGEPRYPPPPPHHLPGGRHGSQHHPPPPPPPLPQQQQQQQQRPTAAHHSPRGRPDFLPPQEERDVKPYVNGHGHGRHSEYESGGGGHRRGPSGEHFHHQPISPHRRQQHGLPPMPAAAAAAAPQEEARNGAAVRGPGPSPRPQNQHQHQHERPTSRDGQMQQQQRQQQLASPAAAQQQQQGQPAVAPSAKASDPPLPREASPPREAAVAPTSAPSKDEQHQQASGGGEAAQTAPRENGNAIGPSQPAPLTTSDTTHEHDAKPPKPQVTAASSAGDVQPNSQQEQEQDRQMNRPEATAVAVPQMNKDGTASVLPPPQAAPEIAHRLPLSTEAEQQVAEDNEEWRKQQQQQQQTEKDDEVATPVNVKQEEVAGDAGADAGQGPRAGDAVTGVDAPAKHDLDRMRDAQQQESGHAKRADEATAAPPPPTQSYPPKPYGAAS